ncbi:ATP-binding protein [Burkholderia ubonensis]|uniref:ATP-binding protein n=1 Tax=Burkholderia ubonensis TaxID=101571 RepID=UPI0012FA468E|nr:helicase HerA-like domain-containing protein [Burkholderia ubonensis]
MNNMNQRVAMRIAELLAEEVETAVSREDFGVIVRDIVPLDKRHLLSSLSSFLPKTKGRLRVSLVSEEALICDFQAQNPKFAEFVASDEETAVQWRNKNLKTIVVVADGPLAKAASLNTFKQLDEQPLIALLCNSERDKAEVVWLRTLWAALKSRRGPSLPLEALVRFAETIGDLPTAERSIAAPIRLTALGLFPDSHLADEGTEARIIKRLKTNAEMLGMVRNATPEDWDRMSIFCRQLSGKQKAKFNLLRRKLKLIDYKSLAGLDDLDLAEIQVLWKGKIAPVTITAEFSNGKANSKIPVESKVAELLLVGEQDALSDVAEAVSQTTQAAESEQSQGEDEPLTYGGGENSSAISGEEIVATARADIIALCKSRSTTAEWGGVIEIESDRLEALTEVSAFKSWQPFLFSDFRGWLNEFVEAELAPTVCGELAERLAESRNRLIKHIGEFSVSPVALLAGRPEVLSAAEDFLETYDQLLKQLQAGYQEMFSQAMDEAERLVHWLLAMELYVFHRDSAVEVLLSPIHPLSLWRSVAMVKDLQMLGHKLSDLERRTLIAAAADDLQFLNVLVLPKIAAHDGNTRLLGHAGSIAHMPLFKEAPRGVLEPDGLNSVGHLAQLVSQLRPFARPGLQVALVNAPRPSKFIESILDGLDFDDATTEENFWGVHLRFRYTSEDTRGWTSELEDMDDQLKERIRQGQEKGVVTLSVQSETKKWSDLVSEIERLPAHLTVVFDPFEVRTSLVSRASLHDLSPWMPTCEYRYNKLKKQIMIVPVAEEYVFATYFAVATLVHGELRSNTATHQPQVAQVKEWLDQLARASTWTVIADPHRVMLPRLGDCEVIDRRIDRARQITTFGSDLSPFVRRLDQQLRKTHFVAQATTLEQLIRDLVAMEPNGILGLVGGDKSKHVKGALGKLIAMRWYRRLEPSGLAVSLDTQNAARWLTAGGHSNEKADLLGLREEAGDLIIDVIEVKTHDEAIPYTINNGVVKGHAVDQVLATLHALAEVFGSNGDTPLAKPRREVLREHLYTALLRDLEPGHIERWHGLLKDLFNGNIKVRLAGRIVHVQLASVANSGRQTFLTASGIPIRIDTLSATDVDLVLTTTRMMKDGLVEAIPAETTVTAPDDIDSSRALQMLRREAEASIERHTDWSNAADYEDSLPSVDVTEAGSAIEAVKHHADEESHTSKVATENDGAIAPNQVLEVELGEEVNSKDPVNWAPGRQSNGFFLVLGASGSGKTETLKVLGTGIANFGVPVLVLDFHGDVVFPGLKSVLMSSGTSSIVGINPMELDSKSAEETGLYDQRKVLRDMIRNAVPALGHRQNAILRDAIEEAYENAGFDDSNPATWNNSPPNFGDVEAILAAWAEDDSKKSQRSSIEGCLAAIQEIFEHPVFQRENHVAVDEILSSNVRLDLSKLPDEVRYIAAETLLRKLFRVLRLRGPIPVQPTDDHQRFRLFVVVDEAKILSTGAGDPDAPDRILNLLFTEARKFGIGMILASQMSDHFGSEVKANAATWLVLKPMDIREAKKNAPNVHVDPEALTSLRGRGDGYFRDRTSARARRIQVSPIAIVPAEKD